MNATLPPFITRVLSVHDGDTVRAWVCLSAFANLWDMGPNQAGAAIRLCGIQCAELHDHDPAVRARAERARDRVIELVLGVSVRIDVTGLDKFSGRYDGRVTLPDDRDVCSVLLAEGLAVPFDGHSPKPVGRSR